MKSMRWSTALYSVALLAATSCGPGSSSKLSDVPVPVTRPTAERPIVLTSAPSDPYRLGLLFGGADGSRRVELRRTMQMHGVAVSHDSKLAAVVESNYHRGALPAGADEWSRWLSIYDVDGTLLSKIDLPRKPERFSLATVYLGPRREALVTLSHPSLEDVVGVVLEPGEVASYHVSSGGKVTELPPIGFESAMFTAGPGYVLQVPEGKSWRLLRYSEPGKLLWEIHTGADYPHFIPAAGFDFGIALKLQVLKFREDGTYEAVNNRYVETGYKERAGQFYEKENLGPAVDQLTAAAGLAAGERQAARDALRGFIYDYFDAYTAGGGWVSASRHRACLERLDSAMKAALPGEKCERYLAWRRAIGTGGNDLYFLLREHLLEEPELEKVVVVRPGAGEPGPKSAN